jgi:hypothetical protein
MAYEEAVEGGWRAGGVYCTMHTRGPVIRAGVCRISGSFRDEGNG